MNVDLKYEDIEDMSEVQDFLKKGNFVCVTVKSEFQHYIVLKCLKGYGEFSVKIDYPDRYRGKFVNFTGVDLDLKTDSGFLRLPSEGKPIIKRTEKPASEREGVQMRKRELSFELPYIPRSKDVVLVDFIYMEEIARRYPYLSIACVDDAKFDANDCMYYNKVVLI